MSVETVTSEWRAWTAGIIDGEGAVGIAKRITPAGNPSYQSFVKVSNTDRRMVDKLSELWGGNVYPHSRSHQENHRDIYDWSMSGDRLIPFLVSIFPFLVIKKERAKLLLKMQTRIISYPHTQLGDDEVSTREKLYQSAKILNKRGGMM